MSQEKEPRPDESRWEGGYIRKTKNGRRYIIERWLGGARKHVSTGCSTKKGALEQLAIFEADPHHYRPASRSEGGVCLTDKLILEYRTHQLAKGITDEWAAEVARSLNEWMGALPHRDLRTLDLHKDLRAALANWSTRIPHRIKALKGLFKWLVEVRGLVQPKEDPTQRLRVPQAKPARFARPKVVAREDVQAVLRLLPERTRDVLHLQTATAMHTSEVRRFASGGELVDSTADGVLAVLIVRHKSGDIHRAPLQFPEHVAAARRLRAAGSIPNRMTLSRNMRAACDSAGVPRFGLGQIRHSVLTWGIEWGAEVQRASDFAGHKSPSTTRRFYADSAVPLPSIPIFRFETS